MTIEAVDDVEEAAAVSGKIPPQQTYEPERADPDALAVSVAEFCRLTSLGRSKAFDLIRTGEVVSAKLGRRRVVTVTSIKALIARNSRRGSKS